MSYITYKVTVFDGGGKYWRLNDVLHREDGPALEYASGHKEWYLNDKSTLKKEFNRKMSSSSAK